MAVSRLLLVASLVACSSAPRVPAPHHGPPDVRVELDVLSFHDAHYAYDLYARPGGYVVNDRVVDAKLVDELHAALTDLHPADGLHECTTHTDDYRIYRIVIAGAHPVEIRALSNCTHEIPWHVIRDGKLYVQYTGALGVVVEKLFAAMDPRFGVPDPAPVAGGVFLGEYTSGEGTASRPEAPAGVALAPPIVTACAHDIESSSALQTLLGQPIHIVVMTLGCDLSTSPDCRRAEANTSFQWGPIDLQFDFTCVDGRLEIGAADTAMVTALQRFVASRPAQMLAHKAGRLALIPGGTTWVLSPSDPTEVRLTLTPPGEVIEASSFGDGPTGVWFWSDLGIDARRLTTPSMSSFETSGVVDFAGKLVPR